MALAPLRQFGLKTYDGHDTAGDLRCRLSGVPSWDILGNVIPYIGGGEEEKIETETRKILGSLTPNGVVDHPVSSARPRRACRCRTDIPRRSRSASTTAFATGGHHRGLDVVPGRPQELELPSAPERPFTLHRAQPAAAAARRQPRRRHGGHHRPAAPVPALRLQVRGARSQHDSRRGRRGDPQRRADASRGAAVNVIMKFGGTSVADAEAMTRVINIVRDQRRIPESTPPVVVVSAMSKVTDRLVETGTAAPASARATRRRDSRRSAGPSHLGSRRPWSRGGARRARRDADRRLSSAERVGPDWAAARRRVARGDRRDSRHR